VITTAAEQTHPDGVTTRPSTAMTASRVWRRMSDRLGRKRLLIVTLLLRTIGTGPTALTTGHNTA
jgi:hypothetical protein